MVAFAPDYTPAQTRSPEKNRVGDFFWTSTDRAGVDRPGIETASGENEWFVYDERRASSLAQRTQQSTPAATPTANTTVELRYNAFAKWLRWLGPLAPQHAYLVVTDNTTGAQWVVRGGTQGAWWREDETGAKMSSFWGAVTAEVDVYNSDHVDWNPNPTRSTVVLNTSQSTADVLSTLGTFVNEVNAGNNIYSPLGFNSNSFAHQAVAELGVPRPTAQLWTPGGNLTLNTQTP